MTVRLVFIPVIWVIVMPCSVRAQIYQFPLTISDDKGGHTTITFGIGVNYTECIDPDTSVYHPAEVELPPPPPSGVFDARFVDSRAGAGACLGQGIALNLHEYRITGSKIDTFKIKLQLTNGASVVRLSWVGLNLSIFNGGIKLQDAFGGVLINWDMVSHTSDSVTNPAITELVIYGIRSICGVPGSSDITPIECSLHQNYPNPFNPATTIRYSLATGGRVTVDVYNVFGQQVAGLLDVVQAPGRHEVRFDGTGLPSGVYYYRMVAGRYSLSRKMLIVR